MEPKRTSRPPSDRQRRRTLALATDARRRLTGDRTRGRAWINGREVGGGDARYAHLGRSYD